MAFGPVREGPESVCRCERASRTCLRRANRAPRVAVPGLAQFNHGGAATHKFRSSMTGRCDPACSEISILEDSAIIRRRSKPMSLRPIRRLIIVGSVFLLSIGVAPAQTPSPEAMSAARSLVMTLKLSDQYKALLPAILLNIKPLLTQGRPEIERDYNAMTSAMADAYTPHYNAMIDSIATVYASNFSVDELRDIDAFYRRPA